MIEETSLKIANIMEKSCNDPWYSCLDQLCTVLDKVPLTLRWFSTSIIKTLASLPLIDSKYIDR